MSGVQYFLIGRHSGTGIKIVNLSVRGSIQLLRITMIREPLKRKLAACLTMAAFLLSPVGLGPAVCAENQGPADIVSLGLRISPAGILEPPVLRGVKIYSDDPLRLDFLLDKGGSADTDEQLRGEASRLVKYFLAALTVPEQDQWVNLSPYEKERMSPRALSQTVLGLDMVAQDYLLKQIAVSMLDTSGEMGKEFWSRIYSEAYRRYGTTDIPVDTFNKLWVLPDRAEVYETSFNPGGRGQQAVAYVTDMHLKVYLLSDNGAASRNARLVVPTVAKAAASERRLANTDIGRQILREIVVPVLEKEVNQGARFARLRQIVHSLILAAWYKRRVGSSLLSAMYVDRDKVAGVSSGDPEGVETVWNQYVDVFEKGSRNYIKKERYQFFDDSLPAKYFIGGFSGDMSSLTFKGTVDKMMASARGRSMGKVEVSLSSVFKRNFRFGLDQNKLVALVFESYQKFFEDNGIPRTRLTGEEMLARIQVINRSSSLEDNPLLAKTYAYMGYAALVSALRTHLAGGEQPRLAASFLFYGPALTYFWYVGGNLIDKIYSSSAFLSGAVMSAVGGGMPSSGGILSIGTAGYFLAILPPGNMLDDGITFPNGEVWYKRDVYNADFIISENMAHLMEQQFNLPNTKLFSHAYGYLMSAKLGFQDFTYFEDANRKVLITEEQQSIELATQLVSVVLSIIPGDLREQEAVVRKVAPALLGSEFAWVVQLRDIEGSKTVKKELRAAIDRYVREEVLNQLKNGDYTVPKFSRPEDWFPLYGYALAKLLSNHYRDPDKGLALLYQFSLLGDVRKAANAVEKRSAGVASKGWFGAMGQKKKAGWNLNPAFWNKKDSSGAFGEPLRFNVPTELLEQHRNVVGFDPVILDLAPLKDLPEFLGVAKAEP